MAEPLSIASGIAGLLSLGIQVTETLLDFYSAYKHQDTDLAKITHNLENLQSILRSLKVAIRDNGSWTDAQTLLQEVAKATQRCDSIIVELQSESQKLRKDQALGFKGCIQVAGRRAAYPFRRSTLQKLEEDISEIRENISLALDVLHLKSCKQLDDEISNIKLILERINASQISNLIRTWLMAPDASLNHNAIWAKRHPSTGLWLTKGRPFANWLVERNSFLWLNGFAGCGKSVLCSTAIQHTFHEMQHRDRVGIAFFYFSFDDRLKQDVHCMVRALLLQLSGQIRDGERELEKLHKLYKPSTPPLDILLDLFRVFLVQFQDCYIFLDALDESPRDAGRDDVLKAIQTLRGWDLQSVHLLVTSRDELGIRESLSPSSGHDISMKSSEIDKDIANFVSFQLENDKKLQRWRTRHDEIQAKLMQGEQAMYIFV
jgi:hypothetical protein